MVISTAAPLLLALATLPDRNHNLIACLTTRGVSRTRHTPAVPSDVDLAHSIRLVAYQDRDGVYACLGITEDGP
jgi:hypothetical protein